LAVEPPGELDGIERRAVAEDQRRHDLVAGLLVGDAVHGGDDDVRMPGHGRLDRSGREVLAVDAQPLGVAPGEVEVARVVDGQADVGPKWRPRYVRVSS